MTLLIDINQPGWMTDDELRETVATQAPEIEIRCGAPTEAMPGVTMLAVSALRPGVVAHLPDLKLVQKLGAGVETIVGDPELPPQVRVARLKPDAPAREIAEYCVAYALRRQRNMAQHEADQAAQRWAPVGPLSAVRMTVGVLGLGHIGARVARAFTALGFRVIGWSRSPKEIEEVDCRAGAAALPEMLGACDYVASVLPSTAATRDLFDAALLSRMKPSALLINVGRGDLIVEADLLAALDADRLGGAVLDVFREEPLPPGHPFWTHPKITVTPHVSGWRVDDGVVDVAENYRRLSAGEPLLHEVDRAEGY